MTMLVDHAPVVAATEAEPTVRDVLVEEFGMDWQRALPHVCEVVMWAPNRKVVDDDGAVHWLMHEREFLAFSHTGDRDADGFVDPIDRGNHAHLVDQWGELARSYGWLDQIAVELDHVAPADLLDVVRALQDSVILDSDAWCQAEDQTLREHWDDYGLDDAKRALRDRLGVWEVTDHAENVLTQLVWGGWVNYGHRDGYPEFPRDPSAANFGDVEVADWIADRLGVVVTLSRYGRSEVVDLRRRLIVEP
ncbi:hypothetical protein ACWZHB_01150 [Nocardia sp. FBN12]|uniref:hypothetical protein n=1 Tax=Nocardia sp. FBN12 TaxID=3419766 RepID=UPI003CFFE0A3